MIFRYLLIAVAGLLIALSFTYATAVQNGIDPFDDRVWPFWAIAALVGLYAPVRIYQLWRWWRARDRAKTASARDGIEARMAARRARVDAARSKLSESSTEQTQSD